MRISYRLSIRQDGSTTTISFGSEDGNIPDELWKYCQEVCDPLEDAELNIVRMERK